jgi:hypothetical protein
MRHLINLTRGHDTNSRETLQWLSVGISSTRRVHDYLVARAQVLKRRLLTMAELNESTLNSKLHVLPRDDTDPELP